MCLVFSVGIRRFNFRGRPVGYLVNTKIATRFAEMSGDALQTFFCEWIAAEVEAVTDTGIDLHNLGGHLGNGVVGQVDVRPAFNREQPPWNLSDACMTQIQ